MSRASVLILAPLGWNHDRLCFLEKQFFVIHMTGLIPGQIGTKISAWYFPAANWPWPLRITVCLTAAELQ